MISNLREDQFTKIGQNASMLGLFPLPVPPEALATASTPGTHIGHIFSQLRITPHSLQAIPIIFNQYSGLHLGTR